MSSGMRPLADIRVLDFGHMVMGPSCGMILADLGAEVLKVEPAPGGDPTRELKGFGAGYFGYFNRNKASIALDLKTEAGHDIACRLIEQADVLVENFGPGTIERLDLSYDRLHALNPRLVYASLKGFCDGPYGSRLALDEVVQMMSGMAYMTGPRDRPLRAGTSVVDIAGGMFAVIAILAALRERERTGQGQKVVSSLYETAVFLMGQHLCCAAQSHEPLPPMPERVSAWAVYELFALADGQRIFVGITTDAHWRRFCQETGRVDLAGDPALRTNNARIDARDRLIPVLREFFAALTLQQAASVCERARIPFAPINRPEELFDDPHLAATGGLLPVMLPNGVRTRLPASPIRMNGQASTVRRDPPGLGQDTRSILAGMGFTSEAIEDLLARRIVAATEPAASAA